MGANPRVSVLRDGYSLPFSWRPLLTRFPLIHSGYANPTESRFLRGFAKSRRKVGSRKSGYQVVSGLLQPALSCPQTEQKMETNLGSKSVKPLLEDQFLQDGNSGDDPVILTDGNG